MQQGTRSPLLADEGPTVRVRVRAGWAVQARDDHAPSVPEFYKAGDIIPNHDADEALTLIAIGAVEAV